MALDFGRGAGGAVTGAYAGSGFGLPGTIAGGLIGGVAGLFGSRKKKKPKIRNTLDPQQKRLYGDQNAAIYGSGPLADIYNFNPEQANDVFDKNIARPAYRNFNEKLIPSITGQFRGSNTQNSSYHGQALANAGRDVQEGLDAQRSQYLYNQENNSKQNRINALNNQLNMSTQAFERPQEERGFIDNILSSVGPQAAEWLADYLKPKSGQPANIPGLGNAARASTNIGFR